MKAIPLVREMIYQGYERDMVCLEEKLYVNCLINGNTEADVTPKPHVEQRRVIKIGRNDPCPCGSEKKYKKCCLEK